MARIVCFANQKGGVGKTTTCVNLCAIVKAKHKKVLLIDSDPQGNATTGMGINKQTCPTLYDVLLRNRNPEEVIISTKYGDVLPANLDLSGASVELVELPSRERVLKNVTDSLRGFYDYIFIDCPPSLGLLTLNALSAADSVLIPMQCEYYALEGLVDLVTSMRMTKSTLNPSLKIEGIVLTMYDRRLSFAVQVAEEIKHYFPNALYNTMIPRNVRIAEAPSHGKPITSYSRISRGAQAYESFAVEFLQHSHNMEL